MSSTLSLCSFTQSEKPIYAFENKRFTYCKVVTAVVLLIISALVISLSASGIIPISYAALGAGCAIIPIFLLISTCKKNTPKQLELPITQNPNAQDSKRISKWLFEATKENIETLRRDLDNKQEEEFIATLKEFLNNGGSLSILMEPNQELNVKPIDNGLAHRILECPSVGFEVKQNFLRTCSEAYCEKIIDYIIRTLGFINSEQTDGQKIVLFLIQDNPQKICSKLVYSEEKFNVLPPQIQALVGIRQ